MPSGHDLDGDGVSAHDDYAAAFPNAAAGMGCGGQGCRGYELVKNLDFDTNGSGDADAGDTYWNDGDGWDPIGEDGSPFNAALDGKGLTIANLYVDRADTDNIGLLGAAGGDAVIRKVRLTGVRVSGDGTVGATGGRQWREYLRQQRGRGGCPAAATAWAGWRAAMPGALPAAARRSRCPAGAAVLADWLEMGVPTLTAAAQSAAVMLPAM